MVSRRAIWGLGLAQLLSWGVTYYLIGVFGEAMGAAHGWPEAIVYGGFSFALVTMGVSSPFAGRCIDRFGGRVPMSVGAVLNAAGCAGLAGVQSIPGYFGVWALMGIGMRLTLYDAAFASLAAAAGRKSGRAMGQITLLGGLASTVFWPLGAVCTEAFGWRGALQVYALIALTTVPLHLALPPRATGQAARAHQPRDLSPSGRGSALTAWLFGLVMTLTNFVNAGVSAHFAAIFTALGLGAATAIGAGSLRGIGQSAARLGEAVFGARLDPMTLTVWSVGVIPVSFAALLLARAHGSIAFAFALTYGAATGLLTIVRGTLPLLLFDPAEYGASAGRFVGPSFLVSAIAPVTYAEVIGRFGGLGAIVTSLSVAAFAMAAAFVLQRRHGLARHH